MSHIRPVACIIVILATTLSGCAKDLDEEARGPLTISAHAVQVDQAKRLERVSLTFTNLGGTPVRGIKASLDSWASNGEQTVEGATEYHGFFAEPNDSPYRARVPYAVFNDTDHVPAHGSRTVVLNVRFQSFPEGAHLSNWVRVESYVNATDQGWNWLYTLPCYDLSGKVARGTDCESWTAGPRPESTR